MLFQSKKKTKQIEIKEKSDSVQEDDYETCVICGVKTEIKKNVPIDLRTDYIPGSGQLCHECAVNNIEEEEFAKSRGFVYVLPYMDKEESNDVQ